MFDKKNKRGFTLAELIVSISIIAAIAGIVLVNYRKTNNIADVKMAAQKLASDIRMVQNYAMSLKEFPIVGGIPPNGWGVQISAKSGDNDNILIFADSASNPVCKYRSGGGSNDELFKTIELPENITVYDNRIDVAANNDDDDYTYVTFLPPDPQTYICGAKNSGGAALHVDKSHNASFVDIDLIYNSDISTIQTIRINKFGLVEVN